MIDSDNFTIIFGMFALIVFAYVYWRNATAEGFSSDKVLDSYFALLLGGVVGGKILFRKLSVNYFRYEIIHSPFIFEGILVGGAIAALFIVKKNKWSGWKIGDMIAPALAIFQAVLFFGFWLSQRHLSLFFVFVAFSVLYSIIQFLKKRKHLGSSLRFFELKRLNKPIFTGGLFAVYLTGSSLIAILFLIAHLNPQSKFWWFQVSFYFFILVASYILIRKQLFKQGIQVAVFKSITKGFRDRMKALLKIRARQIEADERKLEKEDPFMKEAESDGFRNVDELADEVMELGGHKRVEAEKRELERESDEIKETLEDMKAGRYGICQTCGGRISKERLEAYPTAKSCIKCEKKRSVAA